MIPSEDGIFRALHKGDISHRSDLFLNTALQQATKWYTLFHLRLMPNELMDRKQTNLCVSVDVTTTQEVLEIVKAIGPKVCMVKVSVNDGGKLGLADGRLTATSSRTLPLTLQRSSRSSAKRWILSSLKTESSPTSVSFGEDGDGDRHS